MKAIKENNLYRLFLLLSRNRKKQIVFLFLLLIISGISESIALVSIIPYLSIIISDKNNIDYETINKYLPINLNNSPNIFLYLTILFCSFIFISTFLRIFNNWYILRLTAKINIDLSNSIFLGNIYQPYEKYTKKSSSKVIALITEKVRLSVNAVREIFYMLLGSITGLTIIFTLSLYSWKIVLISFLFLYLFYFKISKQVRKILLKIGKYISIHYPLKIRIVQESFNGFRDIIINGTENIYFNLFNKYNSSITLKESRSQLFINLPKYLIEGITLFTIAIIGYAFSISNDQNSEFIPLLGAFVYAILKLLPLSQLTYASWAGYKVKVAILEDILKELQNNQNIPDFRETLPENKKITFKNKITFKKVNYSYEGSKNVLNDVCLTLKKGDHIGIYGETGSGKSTFLDLLMGLLPPKKGSVFVDNIDLYKHNNNYNWTSNISHVPQSIFLKEGNIAENIAFGFTIENLDFESLERSSRTAQIYKFIKESKDGFFTMVGERGIKLSGGQRQRIAIARALYKARDILVLDEATSALDELTERKIIDKILKTHENLTVIMVTHRINSLKNCNRIFKITSTGEVVEE